MPEVMRLTTQHRSVLNHIAACMPHPDTMYEDTGEDEEDDNESRNEWLYVRYDTEDIILYCKDYVDFYQLSANETINTTLLMLANWLREFGVENKDTITFHDENDKTGSKVLGIRFGICVTTEAGVCQNTKDFFDKWIDFEGKVKKQAHELKCTCTDDSLSCFCCRNIVVCEFCKTVRYYNDILRLGKTNVIVCSVECRNCLVDKRKEEKAIIFTCLEAHKYSILV